MFNCLSVPSTYLLLPSLIHIPSSCANYPPVLFMRVEQELSIERSNLNQCLVKKCIKVTEASIIISYLNYSWLEKGRFICACAECWPEQILKNERTRERESERDRDSFQVLCHSPSSGSHQKFARHSWRQRAKLEASSSFSSKADSYVSFPASTFAADAALT